MQRLVLAAAAVFIPSCDAIDLPAIVIDPSTGDVSVLESNPPLIVEARAVCNGLFEVDLTAVAVDPDGAEDILAVTVAVESNRGAFVDRFSLTPLRGDSEQFTGTLDLFSSDFSCTDDLTATFTVRDRGGHEVEDSAPVQPR